MKYFPKSFLSIFPYLDISEKKCFNHIEHSVSVCIPNLLYLAFYNQVYGSNIMAYLK